jgi:hypothetical protein
MHFAYDGFTQEGNRRCFLFRAAEELISASGFSIQIDLGLLLKNRVPMQEAPMFCLNLLTDASLGGPDSLDRLRSYTVIGDDFKGIHLERQRQAAERLSKKASRKPIRKHSNMSNLHLGSPSDSPYSRGRPEEPSKLRSGSI